MGVIRWEERNGRNFLGEKRKSWSGIFGEHEGFVCQIFPTEKNGIEYAKLELTSRFPGNEDVPGAAADALFFVGVDNAKAFAEQILDAWVDRAGLAPKPSERDVRLIAENVLDYMTDGGIYDDHPTHEMEVESCARQLRRYLIDGKRAWPILQSTGGAA